MTNDGAGSSSSGGGKWKASQQAARSRALFAPQAPLYATLSGCALLCCSIACTQRASYASAPRVCLGAFSFAQWACLWTKVARAVSVSRQDRTRQGRPARYSNDGAQLLQCCFLQRRRAEGGEMLVLADRQVTKTTSSTSLSPFLPA